MDNDIIKYSELLKLKTPNTYGENFSKVPKKSGIYFLTTPIIDIDTGMYNYNYNQIIYIGSAKNLFNRFNNHEVKRNLNDKMPITFYFFETLHYLKIEKELINQINPICNYQHNKENSKRYFNITQSDIKQIKCHL